MKEKSPTALCAAAIRAELKAKFAHPFSVRTPHYGTVNVEWTDGPSHKAVQEIVGKYEMGHFDGMVDCYEYDNRNDAIPQCRYVFLKHDLSEKTIAELVPIFTAYYGIDFSNGDTVWDKMKRSRYVFFRAYLDSGSMTGY